MEFVFYFQQNFLSEFNAVHSTAKPKFPSRILADEMTSGCEYEINRFVYVKTGVHEKSVVVHINVLGVERGFFLPDKYAETIRSNYDDPSAINCYQLFLAFKGYGDVVKKVNPNFEIVYKGAAQHAD